MQPVLPTRKKPLRFTSLRIIFALIMREMSTSYGRSSMGYLWAILEPVGAITLLSVVFSFAFSNPPLGVSFPLFYAAGYLPFIYYTEVAANLAVAVRQNKPLLFYPRVTFVDALLARFILASLTHILVFYIVVAGILLVQDTRAIIQYQYLFSAFAMAGALAFGVGVMNCYLFEVFPAWQRIWSVLNRPLFIVSGIFFLLESLPDPYRTYMSYNPLTHVIGEMRRGFYPYYDGVHVSYAYVYLVSLVLTTTGLFLLKRYNRDILDN